MPIAWWVFVFRGGGRGHRACGREELAARAGCWSLAVASGALRRSGRLAARGAPADLPLLARTGGRGGSASRRVAGTAHAPARTTRDVPRGGSGGRRTTPTPTAGWRRPRRGVRPRAARLGGATTLGRRRREGPRPHRLRGGACPPRGRLRTRFAGSLGRYTPRAATPQCRSRPAAALGIPAPTAKARHDCPMAAAPAAATGGRAKETGAGVTRNGVARGCFATAATAVAVSMGDSIAAGVGRVRASD